MPTLQGPDGDTTTLTVRHTATFSEDSVTFARWNEYDIIRLRACDSLKKAGHPKLPTKTIRIALPTGMTATGVHVLGAESVELAGEYTVYPAQPPRPITRPQADRFVPPDARVYASSQAYPGEVADFARQIDLAGQSIAVVRLYPVQYVPGHGTLTLYTSISLVVEGVRGGHQCGDYLPAGVSSNARRTYERMVRQMVVNPNEVALTTAPHGAPTSRSVGPGEYEYVIITQTDWVVDFQPLADWRIKKGIRSTIVTTDWIYNQGGYAGSELEKVRAFVQDAHINWGATCFLLGGDVDVIPYHIRTITIPGYWTDDIPNDTYYADYDEDWVCEVHVTRAPVRSTGTISTFINKIFTYEKNPPLTDYAETAAFFGFDITDPGDADGEICKEYIRALHLPTTWTLNTEYDSEPGAHKADVLAYLNSGHHLVNHHDHCNWNCMGTGWISHGELMFISDVNGLANGERQSILFAVGCNPADFPNDICIGEAFVQNPSGGGIAFFGNTRTGWGGAPEDPDYYSVRQDRFFYRNLFDDGFERLGPSFSDLKNDEFDPDDPYNLHQYCFTQLHLLGDPEVPVWTEDPGSLTVSHDATLILGEATAFPVQVEGRGSPIDGATVCLWKDGDVYQVEETSSGTATFAFTPETTGTMYVTVTDHNYLPYEGEAAILPGSAIPTVSNWGAITMTLLVLTAGTLVFTRRQPAKRSPIWQG
jgi:hypothetical protein